MAKNPPHMRKILRGQSMPERISKRPPTGFPRQKFRLSEILRLTYDLLTSLDTPHTPGIGHAHESPSAILRP